MSRWIVLPILFFFIVTSYWSLQWPAPHYNSPDEMATAVFISQYVNTGSFRIEEPLNEGLEIIHPRSTTTIGPMIVPGGFLGLPFLYATIAALLGIWIVPLLTPLIASLASYAFFYALIPFTGRQVAMWSTLGLLAHPAWMYYTSRGLFPDVLSLAFVLFGAAALRAWYTGRRHWSLLFLVGICIGSSIAVRATAVLWVIPICVIGIWAFHRRGSWRDGVVVISGVALPLLALAGLQTMTYGSPFATGYTPLGSLSDGLDVGARVAPYGVIGWRIAQHVLEYLVSMFWWYTIPIVLGIAIVLRDRRDFFYWIPACAGMTAVSVILIVYYGSWEIRDSAAHGPTIGTSFVRYWLPITVGALPFFGLAVSEWMRTKTLQVLALVALVGSAMVPIFLSVEGLRVTRDVTAAAAEIGASIVDRTEPDAIIVTEQADKILFPERRVIVNDPADREKIERTLPELLRFFPVYYSTVLNGEDIVFINNRLRAYGVAWERPERYGEYWLYVLHKLRLQKSDF